MTPLLVGVFLIGLMMLANFWSSKRDSGDARPLDVDDDLPWPSI
jgi:preprotein translocase subunit SecG